LVDFGFEQTDIAEALQTGPSPGRQTTHVVAHKYFLPNGWFIFVVAVAAHREYFQNMAAYN